MSTYIVRLRQILRRNIHKKGEEKKSWTTSNGGEELQLEEQAEWIMGNSPKIHENLSSLTLLLWYTICCLWNEILQQ